MIRLARSEATKLLSARSTWILASVAVLGTWPMAWMNAVPPSGLSTDSELLFSSTPIPPEYQGFDMAGFGYVLIVVLAALWAGSEYGRNTQLRTTLLATPRRLRVFLVKAALIALLTAAIGVATMSGTLVLTHASDDSGIDPWTLTPAIWANIGGVTLAWTLTALVTFSVGTLARTMILPLILMVPLVIGLGDFIAGLWDGARYLPTTAGAAMYSDATTGVFLSPTVGGFVQFGWTAGLLVVSAVVFCRRDV